MNEDSPNVPNDDARLKSMVHVSEDVASVLPDVVRVFDAETSVEGVDFSPEYGNYNDEFYETVEDRVRFLERKQPVNDAFNVPWENETFQRNLDQVPSVRALERRPSTPLQIYDPEQEDDQIVRFQRNGVTAILTPGFDEVETMVVLDWPIERDAAGVRLGDGSAYILPDLNLSEEFSMHQLTSALRPGSKSFDKDKYLEKLLHEKIIDVQNWQEKVHLPPKDVSMLITLLPTREIVPERLFRSNVHVDPDPGTIDRDHPLPVDFVFRCDIPGSSRKELDVKG